MRDFLFILVLFWVLSLEIRMRMPTLRALRDRLQEDAMRVVAEAKRELGELEVDARDILDDVKRRL